MSKVGDRVGALLSSNATEVRLLGYGVYAGDFQPEGFPFPNPRIDLDDGRQVWGYQCWWGSEEQFLKEFEGRKITIVDLDNRPVVLS